jgi:methanogenic corrinoid protein MtbC1
MNIVHFHLMQSPQPLNSEPRHPIAVVSARTGLSTDVLRVWERRYAAVTPTRQLNGQRLYSDADIERLRLMNAAVRGGRTIARVASLTTEALSRLANEDAVARREAGPAADDWRPPFDIIDAALAHAVAHDAPLLRDVLQRAIRARGVHTFVETVAAPFMHRVGDEWHAGQLTIAQEHLATAVLHDLLLEVVRGIGRAPNAPRVVVATPPGERHVVGAAITAARAAAEGWDVIYLGADLPIADIVAVTTSSGAEVVALSLVHVQDPEGRVAEIGALARALPAARIVVGGSGARGIQSQLRAIGVMPDFLSRS